MQGTVKFINKEKKYGFITGDNGKDYFVSNDKTQDLHSGDMTEFTVERGNAINIKKI